MRPILFLATELYRTHGGVQAYMRRLSEILTEYCGRRGTAFDCVSVLDSGSESGRHPRPVEYGTFAGARGSKARFIARSFALAASRRPAIAVVGHPALAPVAAALKRAGLLRSYATALHGIEAWVRMNWPDRAGAHVSDLIVATTRFTAQEFCKHNSVPESRTRIVPLAIAEPGTEPANAPGGEGGPLRILTVSRLTDVDGSYKGVDTLIDCMDRLRRQDIPAELTIVGTGPSLPRLQAQAQATGLNGSVVFAGAVPDAEIASFYRRCDVFAMPSKGEGFGIAFLEAMRYGKPCLGGNHGGTPEVIADGEDGFLVEHGDVDRMTACFRRLWTDPRLRQSMGANASKKVQSKYLYGHMRDGWFEVLEELVRQGLHA